MKVLWFTNTPCGASMRLQKPGKIGGGWLVSLENEIAKEKTVELAVAFYWAYPHPPFQIDRVTYYPVLRKAASSMKEKLLARWRGPNLCDTNELRQLVQVVEAFDPDIVHIHGSEENFGLIQTIISHPTILSIQGILQPYSDKYFSGIPMDIASRYESLSTKLKLSPISYIYQVFKKMALREKDIYQTTRHCLGRTDWDRRISKLLSPTRIYYVGNEIMRPIFYQAKWSKIEFTHKLNIITTMSGGLYKGLEMVVKTAQLLAERGISFEWRVPGICANNKIVEIVQRWLGIDFVALHIFLDGPQGAEDLVAKLQKADIFCQVSHIENSPNSLCEAMLMGLPIVASFAGGTESLLRNGVEGVLYQDGDAYGCAGALMEMAGNFAIAQQMGRNASLTAHKRHHPQTVVAELLKTYTEVIHAESAGSHT